MYVRRSQPGGDTDRSRGQRLEPSAGEQAGYFEVSHGDRAGGAVTNGRFFLAGRVSASL